MSKTLNYADRCERYARQRGWTYDPQRMSIGHLTPRQKRRALKKEGQQLRRLGWSGGKLQRRSSLKGIALPER